MRALLDRVLLVVAQLEIRPLRMARAFAALPWYLGDLIAFWRRSSWKLALYPCLLDRSAHAATLGEYFWQDLYVASRILAAAPMRHIDVGSRIDGFVAHLACARPVDVYDIRPLDVVIPNVRFRQWDLTASDSTASEEPADCVSCLHTLEHVGLGRYGDKLDSDGWRVGLARLASLVRPGGQLWLSVPVGQRRVEFNAHRVFDACEVRDAAIALGLLLEEFRVLNEGGTWCSATSEADWDRIAYERYRLGIYLFRRPQAALTDAGLR